MAALRLQHRILLLPGIACGAFLVLLALNAWVSASVAGLQHEVEDHHLAALGAARDLSAGLERLQHGLQDAVLTEDLEDLRAAERLERELVATARRLGEMEPGAGDLAAEIHAYWNVASETAERMTGPGASDAQLRDTAKRAARVAAEVERVSARAQRAAAQAFSDVAARRRLAAWLTGSVLVACFIAMIALARWIVKDVARPILALGEAAQRVAAGDLRVQLRDDGPSEIRALAASFRAMVDALRTFPDRLHGEVQALGRAADDVARAAHEQGEAMALQAEAIAGVHETADRMLLASRDASTKARSVLELARQVQELGSGGEAAARASAAGVADIGRQVAALGASVEALTTRTKTLGEVVESMRKLSASSRDLAIDVAIEASRHGDDGDLVAVAQALRDLASQGLRGGDRVRQVLGEMERAIRDAATRSAETRDRMTDGLEQLQTSAKSLADITAAIHRSGGAARGIVASVQEQDAAIATLSQSVRSLDDAMQRVLGSVRRTEGSAESLRQTARALEGIVQSFRT